MTYGSWLWARRRYCQVAGLLRMEFEMKSNDRTKLFKISVKNIAKGYGGALKGLVKMHAHACFTIL